MSLLHNCTIALRVCTLVVHLFGIAEANDGSPTKSVSSKSDSEHSDNDSDESDRHPKAQYVHSKGKEKGGKLGDEMFCSCIPRSHHAFRYYDVFMLLHTCTVLLCVDVWVTVG